MESVGRGREQRSEDEEVRRREDEMKATEGSEQHSQVLSSTMLGERTPRLLTGAMWTERPGSWDMSVQQHGSCCSGPRKVTLKLLEDCVPKQGVILDIQEESSKERDITMASVREVLYRIVR
jgi:hypothetical protein